MFGFQVQVCEPKDQRRALSLLFADLPEAERDTQVEQFLTRAELGLVSLAGLLVCQGRGEILGVMFCAAMPGRAVMVWPPQVAASLSAGAKLEAHNRLLIKMRDFAQENGARVVQALLEEGDHSLQARFRASAFLHLSQLIYLQRELHEKAVAPLAADLEYRSYRPELHADFLEALKRSYEGSLDCPELNGVRTLEEIFASHRAQGEFDPGRWFLARRQGRWVGCLLLVALPDYDALEIAYVAVVPEARGHGLGRELVRKSLSEGVAAGVELVTLAVDARNTPARRMYEALGFEQWDQREAYLLVLDPADGKFDRR